MYNNTKIPKKQLEHIPKYSINMNEYVMKNDTLLIGRQDEMRSLMQALCKLKKNNPLLIGNAGVGKTAIVEGLAKMICEKKTPKLLWNYIIYNLNLNSMISKSGVRGELESRIDFVLEEAKNNKENIILFIDEIHMLMQKTSGCDIANIMKPALSSGDIKCIGATTLDEYSTSIETDKALKRRFNTIYIDEPSPLETLNIVRGIKHKFENHYGLQIQDKSIQNACELSKKYFTDLSYPDVVIDLIDETANRMSFEMFIEPYEINKINQKLTELRLELESKKIDLIQFKDQEDEIQLKDLEIKIENLNEEYLNKLNAWNHEKYVFNQIKEIKLSINNLLMQAEESKRIGNFVIAGKILYVEIPNLNEKLENLEKNTKFEYIKAIMTKSEILETISIKLDIPKSKLNHDYQTIESMRTYLKSQVFAQDNIIDSICDYFHIVFSGIKQICKPRPSAVFFFAGNTGTGKTFLTKKIGEFLFGEKANTKLTHINMSHYSEAHSISNLIGTTKGYVGYGEEGELTGPVRKRPYRIILLDEIEKAHKKIFDALLPILDEGKILDGSNREINFTESIIILTSNIGSEIASINNDNDCNKKIIKHSMRNFFSPEFINRIDQIFIFNEISKNNYISIAKKYLEENISYFKQKKIIITYEDEILNHIFNNNYNSNEGARDIERNIYDYIIIPVIKIILLEQKTQDKKIEVHFKMENSEISFKLI